MDYAIKGGKAASARVGAIVVGAGADGRLSPSAKAIDAAGGGAVKRALAQGDLGERVGGTLILRDVSGVGAERVVVVNTGTDSLSAGDYRKVCRGAMSAVLATRATSALACLAELDVDGEDVAWAVEEATLIAGYEAFRFHEFLSEPGEALEVRLKKFQLLQPEGASRAQLNKARDRGRARATGANYARELGNLPGNVCHPTYLAAEARKLAAAHPALTVRVLEERQLERLGMNSFLSVSAGSAQPAKLIILEYRRGPKKAKPFALVGKGITFDTGGISLKPGAAMDEMKFDMCGAASVLGTIRAVAEQELPVNLVGLIAAAENMPSGTATRPGDIVRTMSGQTVEILNTDAEGRLVLCDTLTYAERYKPRAVVDIATLTGACVVALGNHASGLFASDDDLAAELLAAGEASGDRAWRMPIWDEYQQQLKSNFADMANIGGREAGAVTAACFLARYTKAYPWAHLDIAGSAWHSGARKGATGRPVMLLTAWLGAHAAP